MNRHYIRIEENADTILLGYSDAFYAAVEGDICIEENGGRHFKINGKINPNMVHNSGCPRWQYVDGEIKETSKDWEKEWLILFGKSENNIRSKRSKEFTLLDKYQLVLVYEDLTAAKKKALSKYRQEWLDAPDTGVIPERPKWMV